MSYTGQRATARYVKHAPAGTAGSRGMNGTTLDAATLILLDNDVAQMNRESVRHLATSPVGSVSVFSSSDKVYTDSISVFGPGRPVGTGDVIGEIPWDRRTSVRLGPFVSVSDETLTSGLIVPRKVKFSADVNVSAGVNLDLYFALTTSSDANALFVGRYLAATDGSTSADGTINPGPTRGTTTGVRTATLSVTAAPALSAATNWRSRLSNPFAATTATVVPYWVWFGWRAVGVGTVYIQSVNAWEYR